MPTRSDFDDAAQALRGTLASLATCHRRLRDADRADAIEGGSVAPLVGAALLVAQANVDRIANRVEALAGECDRRAQVCADHAAALARWTVDRERWELAMGVYRAALGDPARSVPWPGPAPVRPVAPYAWVAPA